MDWKRIIARWIFPGVVLGLVLVMPRQAVAHCDGMDGPVVKAAQRALATGNVNEVLIWVQKKDEGEVRQAFAKALAVRKLSPEAREMADHYFFETLVRVHRAGEGAPFTGLKPAGRDLGPAIPAADKAIAAGSSAKLLSLLTEAVQQGAARQFAEVMERKNFNVDDVEAGRQYVKAYVRFLHYVEGLYDAAEKPEGGHDRDADMAEIQH